LALLEKLAAAGAVCPGANELNAQTKARIRRAIEQLKAAGTGAPEAK
jgi:hypothetical protein